MRASIPCDARPCVLKANQDKDNWRLAAWSLNKNRDPQSNVGRL